MSSNESCPARGFAAPPSFGLVGGRSGSLPFGRQTQALHQGRRQLQHMRIPKVDHRAHLLAIDLDLGDNESAGRLFETDLGPWVMPRLYPASEKAKNAPIKSPLRVLNAFITRCAGFF